MVGARVAGPLPRSGTARDLSFEVNPPPVCDADVTPR
jgi:hypothetical protein